MKLREITDQILRSVQGGVSKDDSKFSRPAIQALVPKWRAEAILRIYNGSREIRANKFLSPFLYMQEELTFDLRLQVPGAQFRLFQGAAPLQLDDQANGCVFVGDQKSGNNFIQLKSPAYFDIARDAGLISPKEVYYSITGDMWKVWGNTQISTLYRDFIPADPLDISGFDQEADEYPVSQDVLALMMRIAAMELAPEANRPADHINDGTETLERRVNKANIV